MSEEIARIGRTDVPEVLMASHACTDENVVVEESGDVRYKGRLELALKDVTGRNEEVLNRRGRQHGAGSQESFERTLRMPTASFGQSLRSRTTVSARICL